MTVFFSLLVAIGSIQQPIPVPGGEPLVIPVDCAAGDDLTSVVDDVHRRGDQPVVIEISGVCEASLTIRRSDLTLRGDGTAVLMGPVGDARSIVHVRDSRDVRLQRLTLEMSDPPTGRDVAALLAENSTLSLQDVETGGQFVFGNVGMIARHSDVDVVSSSFSSALFAMLVDLQSTVSFHGCQLDSGLLVDDRSSVTLLDSTISGGAGVVVEFGSILYSDSSEIDATVTLFEGSHAHLGRGPNSPTILERLVQVTERSSLFVWNGQFRSGLIISDGSWAKVRQGTIEGTVGVRYSSSADFDRVQISDIELTSFSHAAVRVEGTIDAATCDATSDASCGGAGQSNCGHCPEISAEATETEPAL